MTEKPRTPAALLRWLEKEEDEIVTYANKKPQLGEIETLKLKLFVAHERSASLMGAMCELLRMLDGKTQEKRDDTV